MAIRVKDGEIVERLSAIVHDDWKNSRALDLSDHGLQVDLKGHSEEGSLVRVGLQAADSPSVSD